MSKKIDLDGVPHVVEWMSLPQVAEEIGLSRQQVHKLAVSGYFSSLHRIGTFLVVSSIEVAIKIFERRVDKENDST